MITKPFKPNTGVLMVGGVLPSPPTRSLFPCPECTDASSNRDSRLPSLASQGHWLSTQGADGFECMSRITLSEPWI